MINIFREVVKKKSTIPVSLRKQAEMEPATVSEYILSRLIQVSDDIQTADVDALVEKLDILLGDAKLRQEMGKNSRKYAEENFSIDVVIERHLNIYNELVCK